MQNMGGWEFARGSQETLSEQM